MATLRPMVPGDYPIVAQIANEAAKQALVGFPTWETATEVASTLSALRQAEFIVAEGASGRVEGFAGYALTGEGGALLYGPLVSQAGHGTGAWLATRIEAMARNRGATHYQMLIGLKNGQGAAWAEWRGYQRETEYPETLIAWIYPGELRPQGPGTGRVRRAAAVDLDAIEALYQECYRAHATTQAHLKGWLPDIWVLEAQGGILGLLHLDRATSTIEHLCITHEARRLDLGAQLIAEAIRAYWEESPTKVSIMLSLDNQSIVALIRRLGFRREIPVARWMKREG